MCGDDPRASGFLAKLIRRNPDRSADGNLWLASIARRIGRPKLAISIYKRTRRRIDAARVTAGVSSDLVESLVDRSIYTK
jgi:hypothetical protein